MTYLSPIANQAYWFARIVPVGVPLTRLRGFALGADQRDALRRNESLRGEFYTPLTGNENGAGEWVLVICTSHITEECEPDLSIVRLHRPSETHCARVCVEERKEFCHHTLLWQFKS